MVFDRFRPRRRRLSRAAVLYAALTLMTATPAVAQGTDEPLFDDLVSTFKKKYLSVGALLQFVADFQPERSFAGNNGFSIANFRVSLSGELDAGFGYFLQTNFATSPAILDAKGYYRFHSAAVLDAGLFKAPFSRELLTSASAIDFVNRSQVVTALAPARQIGMQLRGETFDGVVAYGAGVFNGNAFDGNGNDSNGFMWVARVSFYPPGLAGPGASDQLELALNVAYSDDEDADFGSGFVSDFDGERKLFGADFRWTRGPWLLAGEGILGDLDPDIGPSADPSGFHLTGGYYINANSQLLLRWDSLSPDGIAPESDYAVLGYNLWPTQATEVQANYIIPTRGGVDNHQLLINLQVAF